MGSESMQTDRDIRVRYLIRRDLKQVAKINSEEAYFLESSAIASMLTQRNMIGLVSEIDDSVVGYAIYELSKDAVYLLHLVVDSRFRCKGVGRSIISKIISRMRLANRRHFYASVSEYNVTAQVFLRGCRFQCTEILSDWDDQGDGLLFWYEAFE